MNIKAKRAVYFFQKKQLSTGFALPALLIVASVMLAVLLTSIQASVSVNQSINAQYIDKLGKMAADSGLAMAKACYQASGNRVLWGATVSGGPQRLLKPNTDCTGADLFSCPTSSTNPACYVLSETGYRTKFTVGALYYGFPTDFDAVGIVEELRKTSGTPVNRTTYTAKMSIDKPAGTFRTY